MFRRIRRVHNELNYEKIVQFIEVIILLTSMTKMKDNINLNEEELSKNIDFLLIL